jgi:hypothetical protein
LAKLLVQMYCTNDVMEHWLRSQTHMKWFPYPLQTYKVFETIHILWMGRWIQQHATAIIIVGRDFRKLAEFMGHLSRANSFTPVINCNHKRDLLLI